MAHHPPAARATALVKALIASEPVRPYIQVNIWQDVSWFNRESYEQVLWWMLALDALEALAVPVVSEGAAQARLHEADELIARPHPRRRGGGLPARQARGRRFGRAGHQGRPAKRPVRIAGRTSRSLTEAGAPETTVDGQRVFFRSSEVDAGAGRRLRRPDRHQPAVLGPQDYHPDRIGLGSYEEYLRRLGRVWDECYRVAAANGVLVVNVNSRRVAGRLTRSRWTSTRE